MIPVSSLQNNRKKLSDLLCDNAIAFLHANDIMPGNGDGTLPYRANSDIYWLTGIAQEETALILFPNHPVPTMREILFVKHVDEHFVKWHGKRLSLEEARTISGIENVYWSADFEKIFSSSANYASAIYLNVIEHPRSENVVETRNDRFNNWCKQHYPLHPYERIAPLMASLRTPKSEEEIALMQTACNISEQGFRRILKYIKPGVKEKKIVAELIHEYMQHDGEWAHYEPIVASGENSCILHYITNHNTCRDGDILLIDAAASYQLYNADLTRTIPVNGRYTPRQKEVYNAVQKVHNAIKQFAKAGKLMGEIQAYSNELIIEQLVGLKLFNMSELKQKGEKHFLNEYNYHGFGHFLGLDLHDVGHADQPLPSNAIITVEPGIYIRREHIGVRIENNVVIKEHGTIDLMANIPIEADEIESLMAGN